MTAPTITPSEIWTCTHCGALNLRALSVCRNCQKPYQSAAFEREGHQKPDSEMDWSGFMPPKNGVSDETRELQRPFEAWLRGRGYRARTPDEILRAGPPRGWYIHLNETKKNPILLDVLILWPGGHYIEIEFKTDDGKPSEYQAELIRQGATLCRTLGDAQNEVLEAEEVST